MSRSALNGCLEVCFSPNTISKFVRFFPKIAVVFFFLHVGVLIYSSLGSSKHTVNDTHALIPKDPSHRKQAFQQEFAVRNITQDKHNKTNDIFNQYQHKKQKFRRRSDVLPVHLRSID